jgi:hypothetical protein
MVQRLGGRAAQALWCIRGSKAGAERARLRRPAAVLVRDDGRAQPGRRGRRRFDHVLVDEYQDTNRLQAAILLGLKPEGTGVTVVGDDAQSIYAFRGATVRNILDFPHQFRQPARSVALEQNYRSTSPSLRSPTPSSPRPVSGTPKRCGPSGWPRSCRSSSACPTRPARHAGWPTESCGTARHAARSSPRPCCSARPRIVPCWNWNWNWPGATSPS